MSTKLGAPVQQHTMSSGGGSSQNYKEETKNILFKVMMGPGDCSQSTLLGLPRESHKYRPWQQNTEAYETRQWIFMGCACFWFAEL